jgi:hypothetical protein
VKKKETLEKNLKYFQEICNSDFYKNDREFIGIISKLTERSAALSNTAINLASVLSDAERIKLEMIQNEIKLGLSNENKPYGVTKVSSIQNRALHYSTKDQVIKGLIDQFIKILESYMDVESVDDKKELFVQAKDMVLLLEEKGVNPLYLIINKKRAKVWYLLDSAYEKTLKKFDIDFFIKKIKNTGQKHHSALGEMRSFYKRKLEYIYEISTLKEEGGPEEHIAELQAKIDKELSTDIEPLLIDTKKIMDSLNFMLEELPTELNDEQSRELKEFLPAISEYYIDQSYAISGGKSYTTLAKNLQFMQKAIDDNEPASVILQSLTKLDMTMQHLYILHWIAESVLKEILKCYGYKCSMGKTIRIYDTNYPTKTSFKEIDSAVKFRNDIAHNGLVWNPDGIATAIESYRTYIYKVAKESKFSLEKFKLPRMDRELTPEQKKARIESYISSKFQKTIKELKDLDTELYMEIEESLHKSNLTLKNQEYKRFNKRIVMLEREQFCQKHFSLSYKDTAIYLQEFAKENFEDYDSANSKAMGLFVWTFSNRNNKSHKGDVEENIIKLQKRILKVAPVAMGGKKESKGGTLWKKLFG